MWTYEGASWIRGILTEKGMGALKSLGQNFLTDPIVRQRIVDLVLELKPRKVWEIGPGLGALTSLLAPSVSLTAFEIDRGMCEFLSDQDTGESDFTLIHGDFIKTWKEEWDKKKPDCVCGNLPYNSGSVMIAGFIESGCLPSNMVFMLQKEVAQRMVASPGTEDSSSFSLLCQLDYQIKRVFNVGENCFFPRPKVNSSVVSMNLREGVNHGPSVRRTYMEISRDIFSSRRKTLSNTLLKGRTADRVGREKVQAAATKAEIDLGLRGECLSREQVLCLSESIEKR